jgi:LmbE family N-acetylglucosaminyl deacetylase
MADQKLDIVFAAPHPDDLEIGCGGTIASLTRQGYKVGMVHLTDGEPTPRGTAAARAAEAQAAAEVLGATMMTTLKLTNRELMDSPAARYALASVLRRHKADILVGLAGRTPAASPDHYQGQLITEASRFYAQLTKWDDRFDDTAPHRVDHLIYRPVPFSAEIAHYPARFVVDITDTFETKLEAIACYKSQFDGQRWEGLQHFITSTAGAEGGMAGYRYGELYALPRPVGTTDPVAMLGHWRPGTPSEDIGSKKSDER